MSQQQIVASNGVEEFTSTPNLMPDWWQWDDTLLYGQPIPEGSLYAQQSYLAPTSHTPELSTPQLTSSPTLSNLEETDFSDDALLGKITIGKSLTSRRREQNRAAQRAFRDRQRQQIAELQAKVLSLKNANEKLKVKNDMMEAAMQRLQSQVFISQRMAATPSPIHFAPNGQAAYQTPPPDSEFW